MIKISDNHFFLVFQEMLLNYAYTITQLFFSDWVHTVGLVAIYLTLTAACLALCFCCVWKSCKKIMKCRLPVADCHWYVNQEEARLARDLLNNAGFTPVTFRCKRIGPKRKVKAPLFIFRNTFCDLPSL